MVHFPQGVSGWVIFLFGLLLIAYRLHGIDAPREWIEWTERRFTNTRLLQFIGSGLTVALIVSLKFASVPEGILGWLFIISWTTLLAISISLVGAINHLRHLVVATAEVDDKFIRSVSIGVVVIGLLWTLAPWFL